MWSRVMQALIIAYVLHRLINGVLRPNPKEAMDMVPKTSSSSTSLEKEQPPQNSVNFFHLENGIVQQKPKLSSMDRLLQNPLSHTNALVHTNAYPSNITYDLEVCLSHSTEVVDLECIWHEKGFRYRLENEEERTMSMNFTISSDMLTHNVSYFAHVRMIPDSRMKKLPNITRILQLNAFDQVKKVPKTRMLLSQENNKENEMIENEVEEVQYMAFWKPHFRINPVVDFTTFYNRNIPPFIFPHLQIVSKSGKYLPVLYINEFWTLREHWIAINHTTTSLPLSITIYPSTYYH